MLIEFRIQLDDSGGARIVQAEASPNPNLPSHQLLTAAYAPRRPDAKDSAPGSRPGGDPPFSDAGTGIPTGTPSSSSGTGMVVVIGPIVICGPGPTQTPPCEAAPNNDPPPPKVKNPRPKAPKP
jgi:hypothetical protein